jgi:hypothetical protein
MFGKAKKAGAKLVFVLGSREAQQRHLSLIFLQITHVSCPCRVRSYQNGVPAGTTKHCTVRESKPNYRRLRFASRFSHVNAATNFIETTQPVPKMFFVDLYKNNYE